MQKANRYPNTFLVWGLVHGDSFSGIKEAMLNSDEKIIRKVKLQEKPSFILSNLDIKILNNMSDIKIHPTEKDKVKYFL